MKYIGKSTIYLRTKYQMPGSKMVYLLSLSNQNPNWTFVPPHILSDILQNHYSNKLHFLLCFDKTLFKPLKMKFFT
jgi:hypothetical protein